jgi:hypothetical protein
MDVLAQYEHKLYVEQVRFRDRTNADALVQAIGGTKAREHYQAAESKSSEALIVRMGADPESKQEMYRAGKEAGRLQRESRELRGQAEGEVVQASGGNFLVDPQQGGRGTDREKLAGLNGAEAQQYLLQVIQDRKSDLAQARGEFTEDPERIFSVPDLIAATKQTQGIGDNTIYWWIIRDYLAELQRAHLFSAAVQVILALILAALIPGGGWVAAAALIGSAALSTFQAVEAVKEYNKQAVEYRLGFIEDEPSLFWVGVAIAGAALDIGITAAQLLKMSAGALKQLEVPLREFAAADTAESAAAKLNSLKAKIAAAEGLDQRVANALIKAAEAEAGLKRAMGEILASPGMGGGNANAAFEALYYGIRKGANTLTKLRNEPKLFQLLGDITKLQGATREELTTAFTRIKKMIQIGERKGMDEATLLKYVDRLAAERAGGQGAFEAITEEMSVWRQPTQQQIKAESRLAEAHESLASLRQTKAELEAELRAGPKTPDGKPDLERIAEIRENLEGLSDVTGRDRAGRAIVKKEGEITKAERELTQAQLEAERARLDPKIAMRRAFQSSEERSRVLASAKTDQVGPLRTPPQGTHPDHIVSIKRISEMEGFGKLTIKERNEIAVLEKNLIVMDSAANLSKGERSWAAWKQYSTFYDEATKANMVARETELAGEIQAWILERVKNR